MININNLQPNYTICNMIIFTIIIVFVKEKFILWKKNCKKSSVNEHNKHWKAEWVSYPEILRKNYRNE